MFYFLKRLILFIPTLLLLSILFFYLSRISGGDPMLNLLEQQQSDLNRSAESRALKALKKNYGLDLPAFYLSIYKKTSSDTINNIDNELIKHNISNWSHQLASWEKADQLYAAFKHTLNNASIPEIESFLEQRKEESAYNELNQSFSALDINENKAWWNNYLLRFKWNGLNNQYHRWISSLISGDLGTSYRDGRKVSAKIGEALKWTLVLSLSALLISLILAIPLAAYNALHPAKRFSKLVNVVLLSFYSIPNFWVATLLIIYLAGGEYLRLFPSYGIGIVEDGDSFFRVLQIRISHLALPVCCISYGSLAYLYKQLNNGMKKELSSNYAQTAYSKGLSVHQVIWKHAFRNASLPLITILGKALPALISGSFIIEHIFSIPGMGKLTIDSFFARDYPVIFGILMIASGLTLIGSWLADLFYQYADPRISIGSSKQLKEA